MPDPYELANGFDPMLQIDGSLDTDCDGYLVKIITVGNEEVCVTDTSESQKFTNTMEYLAGTNPRNSDSDGDGLPDGWEFYWGLNPLAADSNEDFDNDSLSNILEYDNRKIENSIFSYDKSLIKGYWKFDGTSSTSASNMIPNSDIAIILNGATRELAKFKKGVNCDGIDDAVRFDSISDSNFNEYTVQSWVKINNISNDFSTVVGTVADGRTWLGINTEGFFEFKVYSGNKYYISPITNDSVEAKLGVWYHLAATYSETNEVLRLYVNGTLVSEESIDNPSIKTATSYNYFCRGQNGEYLNGTIDNIAIWNRAFTPNEISYVFVNPLGFGNNYLYFRSDDGVRYSNPTDNDTDNDGLTDIEEAYYGLDGYVTDITNNDTDGDNISDYDEINVFGTSPITKDTDGDNYTDNYDFEVNITTGFRENQTGDAFPLDSSDWNDTDGDGVGDNSDIFPLDFNNSKDSDGDTIGDNTEINNCIYGENSDECTDPYNNDTDSDGISDSLDFFPLDTNETVDTDGDGYGDNSDICPDNSKGWNDTDQDGFCDRLEPFPYNPDEWIDTDGDGYGDNSDAFPLDPKRFLDSSDIAEPEPQVSGSFLDSVMLVIIALGVAYFSLKYFLKG